MEPLPVISQIKACIVGSAGAIFGQFEPWLVKADAIILAKVLHDWPDNQAQKILQQARLSLNPSGILYIRRFRGSPIRFFHRGRSRDLVAPGVSSYLAIGYIAYLQIDKVQLILSNKLFRQQRSGTKPNLHF